jgi:hypothetical protein
MTTYRLWLEVRDESGRTPGPDEVLVTVAQKKDDGKWGGDMRLASYCYRDPDGRSECSKSFYSLAQGYLPSNLQKCVTVAVRAKAKQEPRTAVREAEFELGACPGRDADAVVSRVMPQTVVVDEPAAASVAQEARTPTAPSGAAAAGKPHLIVADAKAAFAARPGASLYLPVIELTVTVKNVGDGVATLRDAKGSVMLQLHVNGVNFGRTTVVEPGAAASRMRLAPGESVETRWTYGDNGALRAGENLFVLEVEGSDGKFELKYHAEPCRDIDVSSSDEGRGITIYGGALRNECQGNRLKRYWCADDFLVGAGALDCPAGCKEDRCIESGPRGDVGASRAGLFREGEQAPPFGIRVGGEDGLDSRMPRDEPVLLVFFDERCELCDAMLRFAQSLFDEYGLRGLTVLGVHARGTCSAGYDPVRRAQARSLDFPIGCECSGADCLKLASGVPAMVLIDPGGKVLVAADRRRLMSQRDVFRALTTRVRQAIGIAETEPVPAALRAYWEPGPGIAVTKPAPAGPSRAARLLAAVKAELEAGHYRRAVNDLFERKGIAFSEELRDPATGPLAAALFEAAEDYAFARELRKRFQATASPEPAQPIRVSAGRRAFVQSSSLYLREAPRQDARAVSRLYLNTPVEVLEVTGEWARARWQGSAGRRLVLGLFGAQARASAAAPEAAAVKVPVEGYVAARFLAEQPVDVSALKAEAAAALAAGKRDQASAALERITALDPTDKDALRSLVDVGIDSGRYAPASHAAMVLAGPGAPLAPGLEVDQINLAWGCRGDLGQAVFVSPSVADLKAGRVPAHGCAENVDPWGPCSRCDLAEEGDQDATERTRAEQESRDFDRRRARLESFFPPAPFLHFQLRNRRADRRTAETRLYAYTAHAVGGCDELGGPGPLGIELAELRIPALEPLETLDLWIAVPEYAGRHYGLLAATQAEPALRESLQRLQWGDPRAVRGIVVDGMPPRRGTRTPGDPCCCD